MHTPAPASLKRYIYAPFHPSMSVASIVDWQIHGDAHDPNATLIMPVSEEDLEAKKNGLPGGFIKGRQQGLDK